MKVVLTNLSNNLYAKSQQKLNDSAIKFGFDNILSYDFNELQNSEFYRRNKKVLDYPKGLGYWLWKPYIILEALKDLADGDIVIYSDCGIEIIESLEPLIEIAKHIEPILLFGNGSFKNAEWTKRDCFILMNCDNERYWHSPHCDAAFLIFRKCDLSLKFLSEWLTFGEDEHILTNTPNRCGLNNLPGFKEHRWDQSILSILAEKFKSNLYRMPSQFGNHYKVHDLRLNAEFNCVDQLNQNPVNYYSVIPYYNSKYGQLLNHHREKSFILNTEAENALDESDKYPSSIIDSIINGTKIFSKNIRSSLKVLNIKKV